MTVDTTIKPSHISDVNNIKLKLFESSYKDFTTETTLYRSVFNSLGPTWIDTCDIDWENMQIKIKLFHPIETIALNAELAIAFENFVSDMFKLGKLSKDEFDVVRYRSNMLFNVVLNNDKDVVVTL